MFEVNRDFDKYLLHLAGVTDIHLTYWHHKSIDMKVRLTSGVHDVLWEDEVIASLWDDLMWHGSLLQKNLNAPAHALIRLNSEASMRLSYAPSSYSRRLVVRLHLPGVSRVCPEAPDMDRAGLSILYGKTGSGKTTTAYHWLDHVSSSRVVISVEDPPECLSAIWTQFDRDIANDEGIHHLVLRQNPDVLFWGELRSQSAWSMIQSWVTTGHHVLTTMHSDSVDQCYDRLYFLGASEDFLKKYLSRLEPCKRHDFSCET